MNRQPEYFLSCMLVIAVVLAMCSVALADTYPEQPVPEYTADTFAYFKWYRTAADTWSPFDSPIVRTTIMSAFTDTLTCVLKVHATETDLSRLRSDAVLSEFNDGESALTYLRTKLGNDGRPRKW